MGEIIGIVSGKGGVGKTTLCANLAFSLALLGKSVITIDGDLGLKNLDILLGLENKSLFDLTDILNERCTIDKAIISHSELPRLHFIAASLEYSQNSVDKTAMRKLCRHLSEYYDFVIIDAPAGVGVGFQNITYCCDKCLVVATPDLTSIRDAEKTAMLLSGIPHLRSRLVINKVRSQLIKKGHLRNIDQIMDTIALPLLGLIAQDDNILIYSNNAKILPRSNSPSATGFINIAKRLCNDDIPLDKRFRKA